jgi:hypothetical protein
MRIEQAILFIFFLLSRERMIVLFIQFFVVPTLPLKPDTSYETTLKLRYWLIGCAARYVGRLTVATCRIVIMSHNSVIASFLAATHPRKPKRAAQPQPINVVSLMIRLAAS